MSRRRSWSSSGENPANRAGYVQDRRPSGVVLVTDRRQAAVPLPEAVATAVRYGIRWVLLREKDLPAPERAALADRLRGIVDPVGGTVSVAGPDPYGGAAVHLASTDPAATDLVGSESWLVGRSCHALADLDRLTNERYVTASPVFASRSKPGYGPPLGLDQLAHWCRRTSLPVFALGGVETPDQVRQCLATGAAGVAVMGALMRDPRRAGELVAAAADTGAGLDSGAGTRFDAPIPQQVSL